MPFAIFRKRLLQILSKNLIVVINKNLLRNFTNLPLFLFKQSYSFFSRVDLFTRHFFRIFSQLATNCTEEGVKFAYHYFYVSFFSSISSNLFMYNFIF